MKAVSTKDGGNVRRRERKKEREGHPCGLVKSSFQRNL